jgi:hypothetical protein
MKIEKTAHFEAHYQKELDDIKSNMAQMTSLLKQLLQAQSREGISSQQPTFPPPPAIPIIMDPKNLEINLIARRQRMTSIPMAHLTTPAQMPTTIDLTMGESHGIKASGHLK